MLFSIKIAIKVVDDKICVIECSKIRKKIKLGDKNIFSGFIYLLYGHQNLLGTRESKQGKEEKYNKKKFFL